jgi:hypothetical protein
MVPRPAPDYWRKSDITVFVRGLAAERVEMTVAQTGAARVGPTRRRHGTCRSTVTRAARAVVVVLSVLLVAGPPLAGGQPASADSGGRPGWTLGHTAVPTPAVATYAPGRTILTGPDDTTDPFMLTIEHRYYLYTSEGTTFLHVPLWTATTIGQWSQPVDVLPQLPGWVSRYGLIWAPDVHAVRGGWALYFTAELAGVSPPTRCIGSAFGPSPQGPFVASPQPFICQRAHRGSIDARIVTEGGNRLVMLWKSDDNANPSVPGPDQGGDTGIDAQDLSADGRTLLGAPVEIFSPSEPWEGTIVESPDMVEEFGTWWLFFSANWYNSTRYGIGVAACTSPMGPCADSGPRPFLGSNLQGLGPGESSLFERGDAVSVLYNPFKANDPGLVIPRPVSMARVGFSPYGPYLASP